MIKSCTCVSEFQDKEHGKGNRVHTESKPDAGGRITFHCTVCGGPVRSTVRLIAHAKEHKPMFGGK